MENSEAIHLTPPVVLTGSAKEGKHGLPVGHVDIGTGESAYLFRVAIPGVRKERQCDLNIEIERDGTVKLQGAIHGGELARNLPGGAFNMNMEQLSGPGHFMLSFKLPGLVDPRLFQPILRSDGILEGVVLKSRAAVNSCANGKTIPLP